MTEAAAANAHEAILTVIDERTTPEPDGLQNAHGNLWTSTTRLRSEGVKDHVPYEKDEVYEILETLEEDEEIVRWYGNLSLASEEHLRAIIESELESDTPRKVLIGACNQLLESTGDPDD